MNSSISQRMLVIAFAALGACGSNATPTDAGASGDIGRTDAGVSGEPTAVIARLCAEMTRQACPAASTCIADSTATYSMFSARCATQVIAMFNCAATSTSLCRSEGVIPGCEAQRAAVEDCTNPDSGVVTDSGVVQDGGGMVGSCAVTGAGCADFVSGRTAAEAMVMCSGMHGNFSTGACTRVGAYGICEIPDSGGSVAIMREVHYTADADGGQDVAADRIDCLGRSGTYTAL